MHFPPNQREVARSFTRRKLENHFPWLIRQTASQERVRLDAARLAQLHVTGEPDRRRRSVERGGETDSTV